MGIYLCPCGKPTHSFKIQPALYEHPLIRTTDTFPFPMNYFFLEVNLANTDGHFCQLCHYFILGEGTLNMLPVV